MSSYTNPWLALAPPCAPPPKPRRPGALKTPKMKVGDVVHHWTLLEFMPGSQPRSRDSTRPPAVSARWRCRCSCGAIKLVQTNNLHSGGSKSCGHGRDTGGYGHRQH